MRSDNIVEYALAIALSFFILIPVILVIKEIFFQ